MSVRAIITAQNFDSKGCLIAGTVKKPEPLFANDGDGVLIRWSPIDSASERIYARLSCLCQNSVMVRHLGENVFTTIREGSFAGHTGESRIRYSTCLKVMRKITSYI